MIFILFIFLFSIITFGQFENTIAIKSQVQNEQTLDSIQTTQETTQMDNALSTVIKEITNSTGEEELLAEVINGQSIHNEYTQKYLALRKDRIHQLQFKTFSVDTNELSYVMKSGNVPEDLVGFKEGNTTYVIHLIDCYEEKHACAFRINGIATGWIIGADKSESDSTFTIDASHTLSLNTIRFTFCDNSRFCNRFYEAYNIAQISVIRKNTEAGVQINAVER